MKQEKATAIPRKISPTEARKFSLAMGSLRRLPKERFVLHGSKKRSRLLSPRRPRPARIRTPFQNQEAIYATENPIIAIAHATIDNPKWQNVQKKGVLLFIEQGDTIRPHGGYVHVLPRKGFVGTARMSYSRRPVKPVAVIKIHPITPYILTMLGKLQVVRYKKKRML